MRKPIKIILISIAVLSGVAWVAHSLNILSADKIKAASVFLLLAGIVYYSVRNGSLPTSQKKSSSTVDNQDKNQALKAVRDWAEQEYLGSNEIDFRWDSSASFYTEIDGGEVGIYSFVTYLGENNRGVQVFVHGEKGVISHMPLLSDDQFKNPFKYCDLVQDYRRSNKLKAAAYAAQSKQKKKSDKIPFGNENKEGD